MWHLFFNVIKQKKVSNVTHLYVFMWDSPTISMLSNPSFFVIFLDLRVACDAVHSQLQVHSPLASYDTTFSWVSSWFFLTYFLFSCSLTDLNNWSTLWPGIGLYSFPGLYFLPWWSYKVFWLSIPSKNWRLEIFYFQSDFSCQLHILLCSRSTWQHTAIYRLKLVFWPVAFQNLSLLTLKHHCIWISSCLYTLTKLPLSASALISLTFILVLRYTKLMLDSGPLRHVVFPLPRILFLLIFTWLIISCHSDLKCHLLRELFPEYHI